MAAHNDSRTPQVSLSVCCSVVYCRLQRRHPSTDQQARNDLGVAQMGRYEYEAAFDTFSTLVDERPEWINAQVNLAIATLNRQQDGDELRALSMLEGVLTTSQDEPRALYMSGIIHPYLGNPQPRPFFSRKLQNSIRWTPMLPTVWGNPTFSQKITNPQ